MKRLALLLLLLLTASSWTGHITVPTHDAALPLPPCFPCRDTVAGGLVSGVGALELWRQSESPFYLANRAAMLDNGSAFFTAHWQQCASESAPQLYATIPMPGAVPGDLVAFTVPDTLPPAWWAVAWLDPSGNRSCLSNNVWR